MESNTDMFLSSKHYLQSITPQRSLYSKDICPKLGVYDKHSKNRMPNDLRLIYLPHENIVHLTLSVLDQVNPPFHPK